MKQSGLAAVLLLISLALAQDGEWFTCLLVLVAWQVASQSAIHVHMTTCTMYYHVLYTVCSSAIATGGFGSGNVIVAVSFRSKLLHFRLV